MLMVGVSGIRGIVGETLTPVVAAEFAQAYATVLGGGRVVLGRDSRPSGSMFAGAVRAGLIAGGCEVTDLGLVMTPTVGRAISEGGYDGGVIITASHNPREWNGLKFLDELGVAPDPDRAGRIAEIRASGAYQLIRDGFAEVGMDDRAGERHVRAVLEACEVDLGPLRGTRVVLDSVNGAGCRDTPVLLGALGVEVVQINGQPTGDFAHPPEPVRENLGGLCEAVRRTGAALGLAQDPDADRLAIVDERGEYIGEEYTLALAVQSVLSRRPGVVAANLSTSRMIDDIAAGHRVEVIRTPVGEAHVARAMQAHGCVVGGEGNGGVIDPRICHVRDSLSAASLVLQLLAATGETVSELVAGLPRYATIKEKFALERGGIRAAVEAVTGAFGDERLNTSDGVRVDFADGWAHVRPSNTEPILRVFVEAVTVERARELMARVRDAAGV